MVEDLDRSSPYSTSSPSRKNAVRSEIRTACCILWVTITMVYFSFSSAARLLNLGGGDGVQRAGRIRPSAAHPAPPPGPGQCTAAAAARRTGPGRSFSVGRLTSSQMAASAQGFFHDFIQLRSACGCHGSGGRRRCCHKCSWETDWPSGTPCPPACAARSHPSAA